MLDIVRSYVLPQGDDGMPRLTLFDCVCWPKAMMACHSQRRLTMFAVQGRRWHAMPDAVRLSVLPKGDDRMQRLTLFNRVCSPRAVMSCHARRCQACVLSKAVDFIMLCLTLLTVCDVHGR